MPKKRPAARAASKPPTSKKDRPDRDRRVRQADRIARVLRVLELIQSRGRWTTKAIAEELECSERTVYRDLDVLRFAGIPCFREGDQQFIRVRPDFRFPALNLTEDEALGLSLATALTRSPGLDVTMGAAPTARKLAAAANEKTQEVIDDALRLVSVLDLKLADHSRHHEVVRTVQSALLQGTQIIGHYESPYESAPVRLKLHPYRLCLVKNAWYIIGRLVEDSSPKTFRIARFKTLRKLEELASVPEDFDLRAYFGNAWAVYRGDTSYEVEIQFTPAAAKLVTETVWHHTQKSTKQKDGGVILSFRVDGLEEIANWVLGWTGRCRVLEPEALRDLVITKLQAGLNLHAGK